MEDAAEGADGASCNSEGRPLADGRRAGATTDRGEHGSDIQVEPYTADWRGTPMENGLSSWALKICKMF